MSDALQAQAAATPERLTWDEVRARYPDEHVCLVDREGPDLWSGTAVVYAHHPDKKALLAMSRHLRDCGLFWTGPMPLFCSLVGRVDRAF